MEEQIKQLQEQVAALTEKVKGSENATKELAEAKQELKESSQFIQDASVLVSAIMKDPQLKNDVKAAIDGKPATPATPDNKDLPNKDWKFDPNTGKPIAERKQEPVVDKRVDSLDGQKRMEIIEAVENKFKYSGLKAEEKASLRKNVGAWLSSYDLKVATIPVDQLEEKLQDAYLHVGLTEAKDKGITNEVVERYFEDPGKFPSMGSGNVDAGVSQLTPNHKTWAKKLDVSEDKVAANLKELAETGVITYKPKEEKNNVAPKTPSGTPTPPVVN